MSEIFNFKKFSVGQEKCAMKVGTDSVLLGAWTSLIHNPNSILDIGAGTGVLALMLAQRSNAEIIDAIELDENAYEQCVENFENSDWADRLFCYHTSLEEFGEEIEEKYNLIICNPPFFETPLKFNDDKLEGSRAKARFTQSLTFENLCSSVSKLLNRGGIFSVVIPFSEEIKFIGIAESFKLYVKRQLHVRGSPDSELKRSLIEFSFQKIQAETEELIIETQRHIYTQDYINLTKDFYLKM